MLSRPSFFLVVFLKFCQKAGFVNYQIEKVKKQKVLKMLSFIICDTTKSIYAIFGQFLAIFTLFHLKFFQLCKKFPISHFRDPLNLD